jgi:hypothetical protein
MAGTGEKRAAEAGGPFESIVQKGRERFSAGKMRKQ